MLLVYPCPFIASTANTIALIAAAAAAAAAIEGAVLAKADGAVRRGWQPCAVAVGEW